MSDSFWKKMSYFAGLLPIGALFGLFSYIARIEIRDLDLWLHLGVGKYITLNRTIPLTDIFSHTMFGHYWNNHEWLFQVLVYNVFHQWGASGLLNMQIVVVMMTMGLLLFLGYNRNNQLFIAILLTMACMIYQFRFTLRPDLMSLLFFVIFIFILALHVDKKWATVSLVLVQLLWTNMHGFFFFGPLLAFIGLLSEWIKRRVPLPGEWNDVGRLTDEEFSRLGKIFIFTVLACLANPHFIKGALYPLDIFFSLTGGSQIFFDYIQELQKPVTAQSIWAVDEYRYYKLMIFLSFISFVFNRRRIDISALFLWIIFLVFSLNAARNVAFFGFAAYLVIITNAVHLSLKDLVPLRFTADKFASLTSIFFKFLFLGWICFYSTQVAIRSYYDFKRYELKSEFGGVSYRILPNRAVDFLIKHNIRGNFFNDFNSGAYLIGRAFPNIRVFIDGRTELYGADFFNDVYLGIFLRDDMEILERVLAEESFTGVFLTSVSHKIPEVVLNYFYDHADWKVVYFDYDAVIFLKDVPENRSWIERLGFDLKEWVPPPVDFIRLGALPVEPYEHTSRAFTLESLNLNQAALREIRALLAIDPDHRDGHKVLGKIYTKSKDFHKAYHHFRLAAIANSRDKEARSNLALSLSDAGEYDAAAKEYLAMRRQWPSELSPTFMLAQMYALDHRYEKSVKEIQKAARQDPNAVLDILSIGDILYGDRRYEDAIAIYEAAQRGAHSQGKVWHRIGLAQWKMGSLKEAAESFDKAIAQEPENEQYKEDRNRLSQ